MPRFRVRTLMIAVGVVALLIFSIRIGRQWFHRWSYFHAQAVRLAKFEAKEQANYETERKLASDRAAIRTGLMQTKDFQGLSASEQDRTIDNHVQFHRQIADQSLAASKNWGQQKRDLEQAEMTFWDPFAADVP